MVPYRFCVPKLSQATYSVPSLSLSLSQSLSHTVRHSKKDLRCFHKLKTLPKERKKKNCISSSTGYRHEVDTVVVAAQLGTVRLRLGSLSHTMALLLSLRKNLY